MRRRLLQLAPAVVLAATGAVVITAEEPIVPVYPEPHHRQVFQYGPTRILDVQIAALGC